MIERAVEDWLTSASERDFQVPFAQMLFAKGHRILLVSKHRPLEEGKDLVTIDPDGQCCAYQLKAGDINVSRWRTIQGELNDLIELPVNHPSVARDCSHKAYLVTNGEISDEVRHRIDLINDRNQALQRPVPPLGVVARGDMVRDFIDSHGEYLPSGVHDSHEFLGLYLSEGRSSFPKERFCNFLQNDLLRDEDGGFGKTIRAMTSAVLLTSYIAGAFQRANNHYALFEAWTCLLAQLAGYATKNRLRLETWKPSYDLVLDQAVGSLVALRAEALERSDLLEEPIIVDGGPVYRVRTTIVLGAVAALENYLLVNEPPESMVEGSLALYLRHHDHLWLWGESSAPFFFALVKFLEAAEHKELADALLRTVTEGVVRSNSPLSDAGLPSPYFSPQDILDQQLGSEDGEIAHYEFSGQSYSLESLIHMLARRGHREALAALWPSISHIAFAELVPDDEGNVFSWRTPGGVNRGTLPEPTQSWNALVDRAHNAVSCISASLCDYRWLFHFLILVYPHRFTPAISGLLDGVNS